MKKNSLTTAVVAGIAGVAGLAGVANAVNINPDGLGQVLIYPYYTVNANNTTLVSVVNTTAAPKAVKVRFLESLNSAEVLDFNLYLSAFDVWTAAVTASGTDGAQLTTADRSCTVPDVFAQQPVQFRNFEFAANAFSDDLFGQDNRVRQGYAEIIEMGVPVNDGAFNPATALTHANGVPASCATLVAAWATGGVWSVLPGRAMNAPTGGLFGAGTLVDVARGRVLAYNADAIDGFWTNVGLANDVSATTTQADLHRAPGSIFPSLADTRNSVVAGSAVSTARIFDNGSPVNIVYPANVVDAVSAVLMSRFIYNEYNVSAALAAASEWVITFPTKRQHIHTPFSLEFRPFSDRVDATGDGFVFDTNGSCDSIAFTYWDREERTPAALPGDFSPPAPGIPGPALCWEANVLAFNQTLSATTATRVLGALPSQGARGVGIIYGEGWARMEFNNPTTAGFDNYLPTGTREADGNRIAVIGLPVTGIWVADYLNNNVTGRIANYGGINKHRSDRDGILLGVGAAVPADGALSAAASVGTWTGS